MAGLRGLTALAAMLVAGCTSTGSDAPSSLVQRTSLLGPGAASLTPGRPDKGSSEALRGQPDDTRSPFVDLGRESPAASGQTPGEQVQVSDNGRTVTLNFVNADLQEFVRVLFDEVLRESVIVDPTLQGRVTVRTTEPVTRNAALALARNVLQLNGATLTKASGVFKVSGRGPGREARGVPSAENIRIMPVRYISPEQARGALQPFSGSGTEITANAEGRYVVLSGAPADLDALAQVLDTLDVDQMRGMSFALMPLKDAGASAVAAELTQMFGQGGSPSLRVLPIQRMNAVLLMTRAPDTLKRAKTWIEQLDQSGRDGRQVRVFPVQNRRAADLAAILNGMLTGGGGPSAPAKTDGTVTPPSVSPLQQASSAAAAKVMPAASYDGFGLNGPGAAPSSSMFPPENAGPLQGAQVRADTATNSLVIMARPEAYALIESAIRRLDVLPTQVLIEATIAEVGLNETLRHGVRWYFQGGGNRVGVGDANAGALGGFHYSFSGPKGRLVVEALEQITNVQVISSPALTVLDNETANLKVGDQVPIAVRSAQGVGAIDAPVVNDIEMKDTGIILSVTPRVNASGVVMLDISQEVSDVVPTSTSTIDSPTIRQRKITSAVAVHSGAEIVLGGLISSSRQQASSGVPGLKDVPLIGTLFTSDARHEQRRTELLIIIRPTVLANRIDVERVTQEIKQGIRALRQ